ncbi:penicillin-binding protein activator LpoB [Candidatus Fermentibacteria bacterium]|nr:penicillin-binding protein activator LpoB [Candidatus Fermentibacteria bacterium]
MRSRALLIAAAAAAAVFSGCGRTVTRTDPGTVTDLSGWWNDTDARMVADSMVAMCISGNWLRIGDRGDAARIPPSIVVGNVLNRTTEHISTDVIMNEIERAFIESGRIQVIATRGERGEIRDERRDQERFASEATAAEFGREVGAQYVMMGTLDSIIDEAGDTRAVYYTVSLELIDVETAVKVWMGNLEIKKIIEW